MLNDTEQIRHQFSERMIVHRSLTISKMRYPITSKYLFQRIAIGFGFTKHNTHIAVTCIRTAFNIGKNITSHPIRLAFPIIGAYKRYMFIRSIALTMKEVFLQGLQYRCPSMSCKGLKGQFRSIFLMEIFQDFNGAIKDAMMTFISQYTFRISW